MESVEPTARVSATTAPDRSGAREHLAGLWLHREAAFAGALLAAAVALGVFLRLQQLDIQWLIDDEWHAINRIQRTSGYLELFASFGHADYSIPLALLYRWVASTVGLNELAMRLPMLVCGLLTMLAGGVWVWRRLGPATAAMFTFYVAISSLLVCYSRNARPYAITLLLAGFALVALARWDATRRPRAAIGYAAAAWFATWLHLTSAPLLMAPLAWIVGNDVRHALRGGGWRRARETLALGVVLAAAVAAVIVPPLLLDPHALAGKIGKHFPEPDTLIGAFHIIAGSGSPIVVLAMCAFAIAGARPLWRALRPELTLALVGLATALALVLVSRPMWINHAVVLVRYLLPVLPIVLLAAACGTVRMMSATRSRPLAAAIAVAAGAGAFVGTPYPQLLQKPNSFTLHSWYQFDYRNSPNGTREFIEQIPTSRYWATLASIPPGRLNIAVAGHGYESYHLADVRWQPIHRQRLFNAQLTGYCMPLLPGEGLPGAGIRLANAVTLAEPGWSERSRIDLLVWKKLHALSAPPYADLSPCLPRMRQQFGSLYEDDQLVVFDLRPPPK